MTFDSLMVNAFGNDVDRLNATIANICRKSRFCIHLFSAQLEHDPRAQPRESGRRVFNFSLYSSCNRLAAPALLRHATMKADQAYRLVRMPLRCG
jgi:hypothetical protein